MSLAVEADAGTESGECSGNCGQNDNHDTKGATV